MTNMDDDVNKSLERINTQYGEALARLAEDEKKERWQKFLKAMQELGEIMEDESKLFDTEAESWWNNLPTRQVKACTPSAKDSPRRHSGQGIVSPCPIRSVWIWSRLLHHRHELRLLRHSQ